MSLSWPYKDPNEILDYQVDWSLRLAGDEISASTWVVPSGIVEDSSEMTTTTTTIWLSSGTEGATYNILNRIATTDGRTMDQTVKLRVKSK